MRRLFRQFLVPLLPAVVVLATACEVNTTVDLKVSEDGSGTVTVSVGLDEEALARLSTVAGDGAPSAETLQAVARTDDLVAAGWDVHGPVRDSAGVTWLQASKPFGTPAEANRILAEVAGAQGALGDLRLERSTGFASTRFELAGTIDLSDGLEAFSDAALRELLGGEALGESVADIEQRLGQPLSESFRLDVVAEIPGRLEANADDRSGNTVRWSPELGDDPVAVEATSSIRDWPVVLLTAVAVASGVALAVVLVWLAVRRLLPRPARRTDEPEEPAEGTEAVPVAVPAGDGESADARGRGTGPGDTGPGDAGAADTGSGDTGSDRAGSGDTRPGRAGSGDTGSGRAGSGHTGSDRAESGDTGSEGAGSHEAGSDGAGLHDAASHDGDAADEDAPDDGKETTSQPNQ